MSIEVTPLTLRQDKGAALTHQEADDNFSSLRDAINALAALYGNAFNNDGSLTTGSVTAAALLAGPFFYGTDTGAADAYVVASYDSTGTDGNPAALVNGIPLVMKASASNTGASTLNFASLGSKAIRKNNDDAIEVGDIVTDGIYLLIYSADLNSGSGGWLLINNSNKLGIAPGTDDYVMKTVSGTPTWVADEPSIEKFISSEQSLPTSTSIVTFTPHGLSGVPQFVRVVLRCLTAEFGYAIGDEIPIESVQGQSGGSAWISQGTVSADATSIYFSFVSWTLDYTISDRNTGAYQQLTPGSWAIAAYAWYWDPS